MPPRFMERMSRQEATLKAVFGAPPHDPPPYPFTRPSRTASEASSNSYKQLPSPPPNYSQHFQSMTVTEKPALPNDSLVLVIGANSWQGLHIVDQLLERGYRVRGTVRDADKAVWTAKYFRDKYGAGRYTTSVIPDMAAKYAFDITVHGCSGVVHVASVMSMSPDPNEVITPSIAGALNALEAAAKEPNVRRFVHCSCVSAAVSHDRGVRNEITSESWNMLDFEDAWAPPPYKVDRALAVYASSKMQTESAVWKWYQMKRPAFTLNTVLPDVQWGRQLDPAHQSDCNSVAVLKSILEGQPPTVLPCYFVDVQDAALLHVAALTLPDVKHQRIFAVCTPWNVSSVIQLLRGLFPGRIPDGEAVDLGVDLTAFKDAGKAEALLRRMGRKGWTDIETSVERTCESLF